MTNKKPACYAPWITTYEYPGKIVPCCEWDQAGPKSIITDKHMSLDERFNHPVMKDIKEILMDNVLPAQCKNCVRMEKNTNQSSVRQQYNEIVKRAEEETDYEWNVDEFKLLNMDYRESNLCNFSCMMCGSLLSSTHAQIEGVYGKTGVVANPHNLQMYLDRLDEVQLVQCLGGEPMLTESMWTTIKEVKRRGLEKQIDLSIVTNGSLLHRHNDNLLEIVDGFKSVNISVSLDCTGTQHNYWRSSNSWDIVKANTDELYKWTNGKWGNKRIIIRTAIGWPNAYAARDVFDMFNEYELQQRWNLITGPMGLSLPMLPQEELEKLAEYWKDYTDVAEMFANTVSSPNIFEIMRQIKSMDIIQARRDIKFQDAFPDVAHIYNSTTKNKNNPYF